MLLHHVFKAGLKSKQKMCISSLENTIHYPIFPPLGIVFLNAHENVPNSSLKFCQNAFCQTMQEYAFVEKIFIKCCHRGYSVPRVSRFLLLNDILKKCMGAKHNFCLQHRNSIVIVPIAHISKLCKEDSLGLNSCSSNEVTNSPCDVTALHEGNVRKGSD